MNELEQELWCEVYTNSMIYLLDANGYEISGHRLSCTVQARRCADEAVKALRGSDMVFGVPK